MIAALAVAVLLLGASFLLGRAILALLDDRAPDTWSPAVGVAALVAITAPAVRLPGHGATAASLLAALVATSVLVLARRRIQPVPSGEAAIVTLLLGAAATLPYLSNGRFGLLGMGVLNDLGYHLPAIEGLRLGNPLMVAILYPYPLGPHSLIAAGASALGASAEAGMAGLLIAVPPMIGVVALGALRRVPRIPRIGAAALVGMPFLTAAQVARAAYKELLMGLLLLAFALALGWMRRQSAWGPRHGLVLGLLAGSGVLITGLSAVAWFGGAALLWVLLDRDPEGRAGLLARLHRLLPLVGVATVVTVLVASWAIPELMRFTPNLGGAFSDEPSVFQVFGIWRWPIYPPPVLGPAVYAAVGAGTLVAAHGAVRYIRRHEVAVPATIAACLGAYVFVRARAYGYVSIKALSFAAPVVMLIMLEPLLRGDGSPRGRARFLRPSAGAAVMAIAAWSSWTPLVHANVSAERRAADFAQIRVRIGGAPVYFLGHSHFAYWNLRGSHTAVPYEGYPTSSDKPFIPEQLVDFDSVEPDILDRFRFAVSTRSAFASLPPPSWRPVMHTRWLTLWERIGPTEHRGILAEQGSFGATLDCRTPSGQALQARGGMAAVRTPPVVAARTAWTGPSDRAPADPLNVADGEAIGQTLELPPGRWEISVQYGSATALRVRAGGSAWSLPPSLDVIGPYWPAGEVESIGGPVPVEIGVKRAAIGWARRAAAITAVVATRLEEPETVPLRSACGRFVDWYTPA